MRLGLVIVVMACSASTRAPTQVGNAAPPSAPPPAISAVDCQALSAATALAIATVASNTPDCSSIGHDRVVLEVQRLVRGSAIRTVLATRPLHGERLREGATLVIAIEPRIEAAHTAQCVPLPASEGTLAHAVRVESIDEAQRLVDAIADGRACH